MAAMMGFRPVRVERAPKPEGGKGGRFEEREDGEALVEFHSGGWGVSIDGKGSGMRDGEEVKMERWTDGIASEDK